MLGTSCNLQHRCDIPWLSHVLTNSLPWYLLMHGARLSFPSTSALFHVVKAFIPFSNMQLLP